MKVHTQNKEEKRKPFYEPVTYEITFETLNEFKVMLSFLSSPKKLGEAIKEHGEFVEDIKKEDITTIINFKYHTLWSKMLEERQDKKHWEMKENGME